MDRLEIHFSRKKWKQIYHEIDRNYDDQVSFDEFILFLFPDNDVSMVSLQQYSFRTSVFITSSCGLWR